MKMFAFYLPQFHVIPENVEWWGENFTEWTNVRKAKPLFPGHDQPKVPLDNNYYNLLKKKTIEWQTSLLKQYRIDGLIYYHYYFNGKMLLEKPAENLLKWKDVEQEFFFCWANHSWYRSWNGTKEVLMEQNYGTEEDWEKHILYLLDFFKDVRYIKIDNKPVMMLFLSDFVEKNAMLDYFDKRCKQEGYGGIYIIETCSKYIDLGKITKNRSKQTEKIYLREPTSSMSIYIRKQDYRLEWIRRKIIKTMDKLMGTHFLKVQIFDGNMLLQEMMKYDLDYNDIIPGLFFSWDNTPRHGNRGSIITPANKEKVYDYLDKIDDCEFVFLNAWNEWAEGMMMEPTQSEGYKYLEWIRDYQVEKNTRWKDK